jgi:hypothetical protein
MATATQALTVIRIPRGSKLPDNDQWTNRFEIPSGSSDRVYTIAQNKTKRHWGCDCMGWRGHRNCRHLKNLGLPCHEVPFEVQLSEGK